MNKIIPPVKGTRDFYPEDWAFQLWLYSKIQEVSRSFGFQEYEAPIIESLDLYAAKSGEELVKKQAFTLQDQTGNTLALRPEMTPSLSRMIAQKTGSLIMPAKWFNFGRRFRYEKPQKGRAREFFQWDCDIFGLNNVEADAEVITVAATLLQKLGLTSNEVKIKINDRQYLQEQLLKIGIEEKNIFALFKIIDKKSKISEADFTEMLKEINTDTTQIQQISSILSDKEGYKKSEWLTKIFQILKLNGIADFVEFDPTIVRGLDYYTRTVFECWDNKGLFRAILGGGRYDNLTAEVGGKQAVPGVGFAMGDMVIAEVLKANGKFPKLNPNCTKVLVAIFNTDTINNSIETAKTLRENNINTEIYLKPEDNLGKQFKYANAKNIPWVIVIGPEEAAQNKVALKNMETGEQEILNLEKAIEKINLLKL